MMADVSLTSDPHAWLRPYFAAHAQDHTFALRAPSTQFSALCQAVSIAQPTKAAQMRKWSSTAQESAVRWLATCVATGAAQREIELWTVVKPGRELRCVARHLPAGIDLRLMQGQEFRRTELHRDADASTATSAEWKAALLERGWQ
jgi:hypothetical protein